MGGLIEVSKDATGTEAALLYPAALTRGLTPASFFSSYMHYEQQLLAKEGVTLSFKMQQSATGLPQASIELRQLPGAPGRCGEGGVAALSAPSSAPRRWCSPPWWAPPEPVGGRLRQADRRQVLLQPRSRRVVPGVPGPELHLHPASGLDRADEGQDSLDLHGYSNNADVSYLFFGIPASVRHPAAGAGPHIPGRRGDCHQRAFRHPAAGPESCRRAPSRGSSTRSSSAATEGKAVHGLVYILTDSGSVGTFGVMRLGSATTNLWNSVNGGLIEMMGAVQHSFVQDLQDIQRLNQQWQAESAQEANFDDIINGQQLVEDPSTGQLFEAPYSSYDPNGPDGGGYYGPDGQLLNPVSH